MISLIRIVSAAVRIDSGVFRLFGTGESVDRALDGLPTAMLRVGDGMGCLVVGWSQR